MSIKAVFRVQCDGPGREWLSLTPDYRPGTDILPRHVVAAPTAERACNFPGERAARRGALAAGWRYGFLHTTRTSWLCPGCQANPLGIKLPPSTPEQVAAVESGVMPGSGLDPSWCRECGRLTSHRLDCSEGRRTARCGNVSVPELGSLRCTRQLGHTEEHINGTVDWF